MSFSLVVQKRDLKTKPKVLRQQGLLPAVIYGPDFSSQALEVKAADFQKVFRQAGENRPIEIKLGARSYRVLVHDVARHPVSGQILHVDFYKASEERPIRSIVPIKLTGEPPAVKRFNGILVVNLRELEIKAKLQDLPSEIQGDLSALLELHSELQVKDLDIPKGAEVLDQPEYAVVALIVPPRVTEGAEKPAEEAAVETETETAGKESKDQPGPQEKAQEKQEVSGEK
jgi:large subunit ribosomal protein L25